MIVKTKEMVLSTSEKAAKYVENMNGWLSKDGVFYSDGPDAERQARWSGCTHVPCDNCGEPIPKIYTRCDKCRWDQEIERYNQLEKKEWDSETPLYSQAADRYIFDSGDIDDLLAEGDDGITVEDLRLVLCYPCYLQTVEIDYWENDLPDDYDEDSLPVDVINALEILNDAIKKSGPVSWLPGDFAVMTSSVSAKDTENKKRVPIKEGKEKLGGLKQPPQSKPEGRPSPQTTDKEQ